jgi:hypothetical protein
MEFVDFTNSSLEKALHYFSESDTEQIESGISTMTPEQVIAIITYANSVSENGIKNKIEAIVRGLNTPLQLEAAGKVISPFLLVGLFYTTLKEEKHYWKLSPLLVGMPRKSFNQLLCQVSTEQLHFLQNEGVTEPIQHHLTLLSHEINIRFNQTLREIELYQSNINLIETHLLTSQNIDPLIHQIDSFSLTLKELLDMANKALAIAWNTKRLDLIDSFSRMKNGCQKILSEEIGLKIPVTGLYEKFENKLFSIFGNSNDSTQMDAIKDDEPAREALVKFSIWYLRDYWEVGLLPEIKDFNKLDLELAKLSEEQRSVYRQELFEEAQKNLSQLGISTVKDLKKARIFSKRTLEEYIQLKHLFID